MRQMEKEQRQHFEAIEEQNNVEMGNKVQAFVQAVKQNAYENMEVQTGKPKSDHSIVTFLQ